MKIDMLTVGIIGVGLYFLLRKQKEVATPPIGYNTAVSTSMPVNAAAIAGAGFIIGPEEPACARRFDFRTMYKAGQVAGMHHRVV